MNIATTYLDWFGVSFPPAASKADTKHSPEGRGKRRRRQNDLTDFVLRIQASGKAMLGKQ